MANHKVFRLYRIVDQYSSCRLMEFTRRIIPKRRWRWYRDKTPRQISRKISGPKGLLATNLIELLLVSRHYKPTICEISMSKNETPRWHRRTRYYNDDDRIYPTLINSHKKRTEPSFRSFLSPCPLPRTKKMPQDVIQQTNKEMRKKGSYSG